MALTDKQILGTKGEEVTCQWLVTHDFKVLDRNYRKPWGEIDVVAQKGDMVHFVEVKTVSTLLEVIYETKDSYEPEDNVHPWKLQRLYRAINSYLSDKGLDEETDWQLDVVAIYLNQTSGQVVKFEYLEDVL